MIYLIEGNLTRAKGLLKASLGKLIHDPLTVLEGNRDLIAGRIQIDYGISNSEAKMVSRWQKSIY
jgi:uncharacterized protein YjbJ (UPF0337 family)